ARRYLLSFLHDALPICYRQGDAVLRWLGKLLQQFSSRDTFVGHIGGDDFVLISEDLDIARLCDDILQGFASGVTDFLSVEDRQRSEEHTSELQSRENLV